MYFSERLNSEDEGRKEVSSVRQKRIKAMIDEFDRDHSDVIKNFEKDLSSAKIKPLSAQNFFESPNSEIFTHMKEDVSNLKKELFAFKVKYEQAQLEIKQLKDENSRLKLKSPSSGDLAVKFQELKHANAALVEENTKLANAARKFEKKSQERKKNLKQLFELLQEKDREITYYKNNAMPLDSQDGRLDEHVRAKLIELETQYAALEQELQKKDNELAQMNNLFGRITSERGFEGTAHFVTIPTFYIYHLG